MSDGKATINYISSLSLRTIDEVEKLLLSLPREGNKCELQVMKVRSKPSNSSRGTADVLTPGNVLVRDVPKPLSLSPTSKSSAKAPSSSSCSSSSSKSFAPQRNVERRAPRSLVEECKRAAARPTETFSPSTPRYRVLEDKIRVSPLISIQGVILEIDVEVDLPESNSKKLVKLEIECPNFVPSRIKVGGKWKKIV